MAITPAAYQLIKKKIVLHAVLHSTQCDFLSTSDVKYTQKPEIHNFSFQVFFQ